MIENPFQKPWQICQPKGKSASFLGAIPTHHMQNPGEYYIERLA